MTTKEATEAQKNMIRKLRNKKATAENIIITDAAIENLLMSEIDGWKTKIWNMPWPKAEVNVTAAKETQTAKYDMYEDIADGNYAYEYNGKTHFYRVVRVEGKGKWAGQTFVNVQERASDELFPIYDYKLKKAILLTIRELGALECGKTFSEKLGRCWRCGKSLTDEFNPFKAMGLGPDCGTKI